MRAAVPEIPDEFSDIYDRSTYANSQVYLKRKTRLTLFEAGVDLSVLLFFWFLGGFQQLDDFAREFGHGDVGTGSVYFLTIAVGISLYKLPFEVYHTFVLEEEFGFNRMDWKTFVLDRVKGLILFIVLVLPILALVVYFFDHAESFAWLWAWLSVCATIIFIQILAPVVIMPIFNSFSPLQDGALKRAILDYTKKVDFQVEKLFSMDGSRRSAKSNAFFTGIGHQKRVVLFDTLIEQHSVNELIGIVAHEVGHYKKKHLYYAIAQTLVSTGIAFALLGILLSRQELYSAFYVLTPSVYSGLVFTSILFTPIGKVLSIISNYISRRHEFEADAFAIASTGLNSDMISALKKIARTNLSNLTPHPFYVKMNYSHPPILDRIRKIRSL